MPRVSSSSGSGRPAVRLRGLLSSRRFLVIVLALGIVIFHFEFPEIPFLSSQKRNEEPPVLARRECSANIASFVDPYNLLSINSQLHASENVSDKETARLSAWWRAHVNSALREDAPFDPDTDGIVVSPEGGSRSANRIATAIITLRILGCELPIEVWFLHSAHAVGDVEHDEASDAFSRSLSRVGKLAIQAGYKVSPFKGVEFRSFGVNGTNGTKLVAPKVKYQKKNYLVKPAAILASRFQRLLWLDADVIPLASPSAIFKTPELLEKGAVFWPDYWRTPSKSRLWDIFDTPCRNEWEFESGAILIDKGKPEIRRALWFVWWINQHGWDTQPDKPYISSFVQFTAEGLKLSPATSTPKEPQVGGWYDLFLGDKDTFRFAFSALRVDYHLVAQWVNPVGVRGVVLPPEPPKKIHWGDDENDPELQPKPDPRVGSTGFCGHSMLQHSPLDGSALFLHANLLKYIDVDLYGHNCPQSEDQEKMDFEFLLPWTVVRRPARNKPPTEDEREAAKGDTSRWAVDPSNPLLSKPIFEYPFPAVGVNGTDPPSGLPFSAKCSAKSNHTYGTPPNTFRFGLCLSLEKVEAKGWEVEEVDFVDMVSKEWVDAMKALWQGKW